MATNYTYDYLHDTPLSVLLGEVEIEDGGYLHNTPLSVLLGEVEIEDGGEFQDDDSSMSYCGICMERKEKTQMFKGSSCAHSHCSDCMSKHVHAKLDGNVASVGCPTFGCKVVLDLETCRRFLPKRVIEDWSTLLCRELIDESQRIYCPYEDCSAMMIADGSSIAEAECPFCHRLFCARCSVPWHDGMECDEFRKLGANEKKREDTMVRRLAKKNKWSRCPKCKFYVERTEGCAHMVCRCKFEFCYGCEKEWSANHGGCARD